MPLYFSADMLFQLPDCRVPLGTQHWLKGLIQPFESLFPDFRVPNDETTALQYLTNPHLGAVKQPHDPEMKRDWIGWVGQEIQLRLRAAGRFYGFLTATKDKATVSLPIILFLREFRQIKYDAFLGVHMATKSERDSVLRDKVEQIFPEHPVFWIANPLDDLSRSWAGTDFQLARNANSIPYIASDDWMACVKLLAMAADIIVMSNTKSEGGVAREVAVLQQSGVIDRTFFSDPGAVGKRQQLKSLDDLKSASLQCAKEACHDKLLELPPLRHWADRESLEYSRHYIEILDACAGDLKDRAGSVTADVFVAVFMALSALLVFRGELKHAAAFYDFLATIIARRPEAFSACDTLAVNALTGTAKWYAANADLYTTAHAMEFLPNPHAS